MNEENQTTVPEDVENPTDTEITDSEGETTLESEKEIDLGTSPNEVSSEGSEIIITAPIDFREKTVIGTEKGEIHVIHEITLGDVILSTLIMALLIFQVLDRVIRR